MTSTARRKTYIAVAVSALLLVGAGGGGYYWYRSQLPKLPNINTDGLDPEVVEAIHKARKSVEDNPRSADTWGELGLVLFAHSLYPEALPCFEKAEALDANDVRWPYYLALILILGETEKALPALDRAVERGGRDYAPRLRRAETLQSLERWDQAEAAFNDVIARHPNNPRGYLGLGVVAYRRGKLQEAIPLLLPLVNEATCRKTARDTLARIYRQRGEDAEADVHERASKTLPKDVSWPDPHLNAMEERQVGLMMRIQRSDRLIAAQQFDEARNLLRQIVQLYPNADEAHLNLGRVYLSTGDPVSAERALRDAIRLAPKTVVAHFLLGAALFQQGDVPGAEKSFRDALALKPDDALSHFNLGHCRANQKDDAGALDAYRAAIRYRPNLFEAHLAAGELLLKKGDKKAALPFLQDAIRLNADHEKAKQLLQEAQGPAKR